MYQTNNIFTLSFAAPYCLSKHCNVYRLVSCICFHLHVYTGCSYVSEYWWICWLSIDS